MKKVSVCIDLEDEKFRAYEAEAKRRGTTVEELVKHAVHLMFLEQEERLKEEEDDHPIHIS
jgi:hypothetical protein